MRFSDHQNSVKSSPKVQEMAFQRLYISKFSGQGIPPYLRRGLPTSVLGSRAFGTRPGAPTNFGPGGPWANVTPLSLIHTTVWKQC